jgi:hypothetical protein
MQKQMSNRISCLGQRSFPFTSAAAGVVVAEFEVADEFAFDRHQDIGLAFLI